MVIRNFAAEPCQETSATAGAGARAARSFAGNLDLMSAFPFSPTGFILTLSEFTLILFVRQIVEKHVTLEHVVIRRVACSNPRVWIRIIRVRGSVVVNADCV